MKEKGRARNRTRREVIETYIQPLTKIYINAPRITITLHWNKGIVRARGERVPSGENVLRCQLSRSVSLKSPSLPCVSIKSEKLTFPERRRHLVAQIYLMMYHDGWDYWPSGEQATALVFLITARAFHKIYNILNGRAQVFNSQDSWADYGIERRLCAGQINYRCSSGAVKIRFCGWTAYNSYSAYVNAPWKWLILVFCFSKVDRFLYILIFSINSSLSWPNSI